MRTLIRVIETSYSLPVLRRVIGDSTLYTVGVPDVETLLMAVWSAIDDASDEHAYSTHYVPHAWDSFLSCVLDELHPGFGSSITLEYVFKLYDEEDAELLDREIGRILHSYSSFQQQEGA